MSILVKSFEEVAEELRHQDANARGAVARSSQNTIKRVVGTTWDPVADAFHDMSHTTSYAAESLTECAKRNPGSTLLFVAVIGFLVGWVVRDRQE
jgi:hypothetical protein